MSRRRSRGSRGFVEFAPGNFARIGEVRVIDGVSYVLGAAGWEAAGCGPGFVTLPAELRSRPVEGDHVRPPRGNANWTCNGGM